MQWGVPRDDVNRRGRRERGEEKCVANRADTRQRAVECAETVAQRKFDAESMLPLPV
jgi:hypothetical protein